MDSWKIPFLITVLLNLVTSSSGQSRGDTAESNDKYIDEAKQIVNTIFHNYRESVPPRRHYPDPVTLAINLHVLYVSDIDVVAQTLTSTVELEVTWIDMRLSWYPLTVYEITIPPSRVWIPNLSLDNAISAPSIIENEKYVIKSTGQLYMYRRMQLTTACPTNSTDNAAECEITVGSNLLNSEIIDINMNDSACDVRAGVSDHRIEVNARGVEKRLTERSWLKENATFTQFSCSLNVKLTGCCGKMTDDTASSSTMDNGSLVTKSSLLGFLLAMFVSILAYFY